jgi:hypothetical protein
MRWPIGACPLWTHHVVFTTANCRLAKKQASVAGEARVPRGHSSGGYRITASIRLRQHDQSILLETQPRPECPCAKRPGKRVWFVPFQMSARTDPEATPWLVTQGEHQAWKYPGQDNRTYTPVLSQLWRTFARECEGLVVVPASRYCAIDIFPNPEWLSAKKVNDGTGYGFRVASRNTQWAFGGRLRAAERTATMSGTVFTECSAHCHSLSTQQVSPYGGSAECSEQGAFV